LNKPRKDKSEEKRL